MANVFIALGSNQGDRNANIRSALQLLAERKIEIIKQSTIRETDPVGGPPQGKYLNCVLQIHTELEACKLLKVLKDIEIKIGRKETIRNGPRVIDLDILLYDELKINEKDLIIPHPRMFQREFVLTPLREIAPEHPTLKHLCEPLNP